MTTRAHKYNASKVQVSLGGTRLTGFGDDDVIMLEPVSAAAESTISADGTTYVAAFNNDGRYKLTLMLSAHSAARARLSALRRAQLEAESGELAELPFRFFDPSNGDRVTARFAVFMTRPSFGAKKGGREAETIEMELPSITYTQGPL